MSQVTSIEWTRGDDGAPGRTWNPVRGCSRVSEGCTQCYAERMAARFSGPGLWAEGIAENTPGGPRWTGRVELVASKLTEPLGWRKPCRVFVNSMSDLFHEGLPDEAIDQVFAAMAIASQHTFQVLTKRPQRMRDYIGSLGPREGNPRVVAILNAMNALDPTGVRRPPLTIGHPVFRGPDAGYLGIPWPLPNVWLGTSVEDQATAASRIPHLLGTPAAVRFISAEPLLGPVDLSRWLMGKAERQDRRTDAYQRFAVQARALPPSMADPAAYSPSLDWVIVGGESGPGARPMHPDWARRLRDQCAGRAAFFFKQWGAWAPWDDDNWSLPAGCDDVVAHEAAFRVDGVEFLQVGKGAAGRLLDGVEHNAFPGGAA